MFFPGLEALRKNNNPVDLLPRFTQESHGSFVEDIAQWTTAIAHMIPKARERRRPAHDVHEFAITLHSTIQRSLESLTCSCSLPHEGLLFMANHQNFSEAKDNEIRFDMLFTAPMSMGQRWCDSQVKVPVSAHVNIPPATEPRPSAPDDVKILRFESNPGRETPASICSYLARCRQWPTLRVALLADNGALRRDRSREKTRLEVKQLSSARVISFREFLDSFSDGPELSLEVLTQLAVLLSTSFLHHYGGPWIPDRLNKDQFHFIHTESGPLLIPFLRFVPTETSRELSTSQNIPRDPAIPSYIPKEQPQSRLEYDSSQAARVELGILLLELFQQKTLEIAPAEVDPDGDSMELLEAVFEADKYLKPFYNDEQYQLIVDAIDACLDISRDPLSGEFEEYEFFYQSVIRPLEDQLIKLTNGVAQPEILDAIILQGSTAQLKVAKALASLSMTTRPISDPAISQNKSQTQSLSHQHQMKTTGGDMEAGQKLEFSSRSVEPAESGVLSIESSVSNPKSREKPWASNIVSGLQVEAVAGLPKSETRVQVEACTKSNAGGKGTLQEDRYIKYLNFLVQEMKTSKRKLQRSEFCSYVTGHSKKAWYRPPDH
jgi:hypothetical protein